MKLRDIITTAVRHPGLLRSPSRYLLLISHMRANTSVLGHIFGSHPDISGYYEQHIGYYSARSLFRSRLLFHKRNPKAPVTPIYFDKILHNYHEVHSGVVTRQDVCPIFALRAPESSIRSIMALYARVDPGHEWASARGATMYYRKRLVGMKELWLKTRPENARVYLDSEAIVTNTEEALTALSERLELAPRLKSEYDTFALTGKRGYGDSSEAIAQGRVAASGETYTDIQIPPAMLNEARDVYRQVRDVLALDADPRLLASPAQSSA